jgi:hypothetical protein
VSFSRVHEVEDVRAVRESEKAVLCELSDGTRHWVPKSQIDSLSDVKSLGDSGMLTVSRWWAERALGGE